MEPRETPPPGRAEVRVHQWYWRDAQPGRAGPSWLGLFLVVLGGLLLLEQLSPETRGAGHLVVLALGLAFLASWAVGRRAISLYAGAILTAVALPGVLDAVGLVSGPGWGTLFLGLAFLFVAAVRAAGRGGFGWQLWIGAILAVIGGSQVASQSTARLLWPALLVALGLIVLARGMGRRPV